MRRLAGVILVFGIACCAQTKSALEADPSGWKDIMPAASLAGWTRQLFMARPNAVLPPVSQWKVDEQNHTLLCEGNGGHDWLRYDQELGDAIFHAEYRFTKIENGKGYNSGVMLRNSADGTVYFQAQAGEAGTGYLFGSFPVDGSPRRMNLQKSMTEDRVKPAGEWNVFEMRAEGPKITVWVNGAVTSEYSDPAIPLKGYAGLEGEGYRIEFRNIKIKALK